MPPTDESQDDLSVTRPKSWAAGVPGVRHALRTLRDDGPIPWSEFEADYSQIRDRIVRLEPVAGGGG
jgi:hypothetical protein